MMMRRVRAMLEPDAIQVLKEYGIPYPEHGVAQNAHEAIRIAEQIGYPVVLKVVSPDVLHKSDLGGVKVGLANPRSLEEAVRGMVTHLEAIAPGIAIAGFLVCRQAGAGQEVIVGGLEDETFGPVAMVGLGGIFAEVLNDVAFRVVPFERYDAEDMIQRLRGFRLLTGTRGQVPYDTRALVDLILAVSHMLAERGDIAELDLNPIRVFEHGLQVLDVRLSLKEQES